MAITTNSEITGEGGGGGTDLTAVNAAISALQTGKSDTGHSHAIAAVTGLQAALDALDAEKLGADLAQAITATQPAALGTDQIPAVRDGTPYMATAAQIAALTSGGGAPATLSQSVSEIRLAFRRAMREHIRAKLDYAERRWDALVWRPGEAIEVGMCRLPTIFRTGSALITMKIHRAITAGVTGGVEPTWATADYHVTPGSSDTVDGGVTWRAYNIYFFDTVAGNDTTGDGSQATPYQTLAMATIYGNTSPYARMRSGRAIALKRGSVFNSGLQAGSTNARLLLLRDSSDTATYPERVNLLAYGHGPMPRIEIAGVRFGIQIATSSATKHNGFVTISGIDIGGDVAQASSSGGSLNAGVNPNTEYASIPTSVKIINCRFKGLSNSLGTAASTDINAIQMFGTDCGIYNTVVDDTWDDGVWHLGSNFEAVGNRISRAGMSVSLFPSRQRGDCLQVNSTLHSAGDIPAHNVLVTGNVLDHSSHPEKHALVVNPELTGTNRRAKGYEVSWNDVVGYGGSSGVTSIAGYFSGFDGDVVNNLFDFGHQTTLDRGVYLFAGARFMGNLLVSRGAMSAVQAGTNTLGGGTTVNTADGSEIAYNTFVSTSGQGSGLISTAGAGTIAAHSNLFVGFSNGLDVRAGVTHRANAYVGVTTPVTAASSVATDGGGSVTGSASDISGLRPSGAAVKSAGVMSARSFIELDATGAARSTWPVCPGALEAV